MDREFYGEGRLGWLDNHSITYVLRIKKNIIVGNTLAHSYRRKAKQKVAIF